MTFTHLDRIIRPRGSFLSETQQHTWRVLPGCYPGIFFTSTSSPPKCSFTVKLLSSLNAHGPSFTISIMGLDKESALHKANLVQSPGSSMVSWSKTVCLPEHPPRHKYPKHFNIWNLDNLRKTRWAQGGSILSTGNLSEWLVLFK